MDNFLKDIIKLPVDKIIPNKYNPNEMDEKTFAGVKKNIEKEGFLIPVFVRENKNGTFGIIDGEHRWRAAKELGRAEIPAIVVNKNDVDSMIATISMNRLRGENDIIKLAEVVDELLKTYTIEDLEDKLGYTKEEIERLDTLLDYNQNDLLGKDKLPLPGEGEGLRMEFNVLLSKDTYEMLLLCIEKIGIPDQANSFVALCKEYLDESK